MAGIRPGVGILGATDGHQHGDRAVVPGLLRGYRVSGADGAAASAVGPAGLPGGGGVPVDQQGVESAVLAVAGAAGGTGAAASPHSAGLDDDRRAGVGAADALPVRRAE